MGGASSSGGLPSGVTLTRRLGATVKAGEVVVLRVVGLVIADLVGDVFCDF